MVPDRWQMGSVRIPLTYKIRIRAVVVDDHFDFQLFSTNSKVG